MLTFRHSLASLYTEDNAVIELAAKVLIVGSIYQINDCLSCATAGVLRGQGRQMIGGIVNLIGYYCITICLYFGIYFPIWIIRFMVWNDYCLDFRFIYTNFLSFLVIGKNH